MPMKKFLQRKRKVGAGSPGDENTPSAVFTYKPRKPRLWMKYWKSVLRRSKQIHFGHLLIEFFMSGIICYVSFFVMRAINIYLEAESQVLESGQANSSQSFSSVILEALKSPKKLEELRKFFVLFLVLFHVVKLSPRLCSWAFGYVDVSIKITFFLFAFVTFYNYMGVNLGFIGSCLLRAARRRE
jgi:hypothetical protein